MTDQNSIDQWRAGFVALQAERFNTEERIADLREKLVAKKANMLQQARMLATYAELEADKAEYRALYAEYRKAHEKLALIDVINLPTYEKRFETLYADGASDLNFDLAVGALVGSSAALTKQGHWLILDKTPCQPEKRIIERLINQGIEAGEATIDFIGMGLFKGEELGNAKLQVRMWQGEVARRGLVEGEFWERNTAFGGDGTRVRVRVEDGEGNVEDLDGLQILLYLESIFAHDQTFAALSIFFDEVEQ